MKDLTSFKKQISEDIQLIKDDFSYRQRYAENNYVFNHWILDKIYSLNEDSLIDNITDKSGDNEIDCFVHYEDVKELYIIQNKYYWDSNLTADKLGKFLTEPIAILENGRYANENLQKAYKKAKLDNEYRIFLYLYSTEEGFSQNLYNTVKHYNSEHQPDITAGIFDLADLYDLYYKSKSHGSSQSFKYTFENINPNRILDFSDDKGLLHNKFSAKYVVVSIVDVYKLYFEAKNNSYNLFDENIREYLGSSKINKGIIGTLKSNSEKRNFFHYNNGITIACKPIVKINTEGMRERKYHSSTYRNVVLTNPQIINGCQTVNAIHDVLSNIDDFENKYNDTFVLLKLLDFDSGNTDSDNELYQKIVECTNSQNAIKPSDFAKNKSYFERIQIELENRGVLLEVRRSDKHKFKNISEDIRSKMLDDLRKRYDQTIEMVDSIFSLEKMILVYLSLVKDGHAAYTKKQDIFNINSREYFDSISKKIDKLSFDNLIRMYCLFIRAEKDKKRELKKENGKKYIPYYMFSFIGDFLGKDKEDYIERLNLFFELLYNCDTHEFEKVYSYFINLTNTYQKKFKKMKGIEYNNMIKSQISEEVFAEAREEYEEYNREECQIVKKMINSLDDKLQ